MKKTGEFIPSIRKRIPQEYQEIFDQIPAPLISSIWSLGFLDSIQEDGDHRPEIEKISENN